MKKIVAAVVAVVAVLVVVGVVVGDDDNGGNDEDGTEVIALGVSPAEADCLPVEHETPIPQGGQHRAGNLQWPDTPPNSGEHHAQTLSMVKRFYERNDNPPPERVVHNLEHGIVAAWYDPQLPDAEVDALRRVTDAMPTRRFMAVPWNRSTFGDGRHVVLTAWGHTQRCRRVSGQVLYDFTRAYADKDAPEKGYNV